MNDRTNMDSLGTVNSDDVLVANETNVKGGRGSVCHGRFNCGRYFRWYYFCFLVALVFGIMGFVNIKVNAAESNVYVDEEYILENFPDYDYWILVDDIESDSLYYLLFSDAPILGSVNSYDYYTSSGAKKCGLMYMHLDENNNIVMLTGPSPNYYNDISVNGFWFNEFFSTLNTCEIVYANHDIYTMKNSADGYVPGDYVVLERSGISTGTTPTPDVSVSCKFTDENIVASINSLNENLVAKMDIIITLLLVMIALKMFSPLANNYKRGLQKKEK